MSLWRKGSKHGKEEGTPKQQQRILYLIILRDLKAFAAFSYGKAFKSKATAAGLWLLQGEGGSPKDVKNVRVVLALILLLLLAVLSSCLSS